MNKTVFSIGFLIGVANCVFMLTAFDHQPRPVVVLALISFYLSALVVVGCAAWLIHIPLAARARKAREERQMIKIKPLLEAKW